MFNIFVKINNNIILIYLMEIHKNNNNLGLLCYVLSAKHNILICLMEIQT